MPRIVVIGAGPAGTVASIALARAGINVTLIEQHRFPRDKVCGECLSALGIEVLGRLGLHDSILALRPVILRRGILHTCDGEFAEIPLARPMWGLSRLAFDQLLLTEAQPAGVRLIQPARCEQITPGPTSNPVARIRRLDTNSLETIEADYVIVADGKGAISPTDHARPTGDLGLKAHFRNLDGPSDTIELFGVQGHYGGIAPIEGGLWNVAFSVPAERFRSMAGDLDRLFAEIATENPALRNRMRRAERSSSWLVSPLPRFAVASNWPRRIIPIGNAAAAVEPIGGEGMGLAMRSAELAADAIIESVRSGNELDVARLRATFRQLWTLRRLACRIGARLVSSPSLSRLAIPLATHTDGPAALALRMIGK